VRPVPINPAHAVFAVLALVAGQVLEAALPQPIRSGIFLDCGGNYSVKALFDHPFASGSTQFVANSGFESPSLNGQLVQTYPSGNLAGWMVQNIDLQATPFINADSGSQSIDLNSTLPGSIQQTLPTQSGENVLLAFSYSYNYQSLAPAPSMIAEVLWNGVPVDTVQVASNASHAWQRSTVPLVAKGSDVLTFESLNQGDAGIELDDITITGNTVSAQALGNSTVTLKLPNGTTLPSITVPASAVTFDAAGTTATIPLGKLPANSAYKGSLSVQVSDGSGTWTTESVAVDDSVGPWADSARIVRNLLGNPTDSVYFWTSEPIGVGAGWTFLVDRLGSNGAPSTSVSDVVSLVDSSKHEYLATLPSGELRPGDSLRLNPAAATDAPGNFALDCDRDVPLETLARSATSDLPQPVRAGIFLDCGGNYSVKALFSKPFVSGSTQIVDNSGFEVPALQFPAGAAANTQFQEYGIGTLGGWAVDNIDLVTAGYMSPDSGQQSIDLNGSAPGSIQQTLNTTAGQNVILRMGYTYNHSCIDLSGPPPNTPAAYTAQVLWNGAVVGTISVPSGAPRVWARDSLSLVARGSDVLRIQSTTSGMCGNMLDDITITTSAASSQALGNSTVTLKLPNGTTLPPIAVPASAVTFDAAGTTATIPLGRLPLNSAYKGNLSVQVSDGSGTWTTESVAVDDSVGPWVDSARLAPNLHGGTMDSVYFWTSESIPTGLSWTFLVDPKGSSGSPSIQVSGDISLVDAAANQYLALVPSGELGMGDSLRLNPAAVADSSGNPASDCNKDVLLGDWAGGGPTVVPIKPRIQIQTHPFLDDSDGSIPARDPLQVWIRRAGGTSWIGSDGSPVVDTNRYVGATVTSNVPLYGTVYIVDNEGVFAVSGDLCQVGRQASQGLLPTDSSGNFQFRIAWDGRISDGSRVSSGIYVVRLVLVYAEGVPKKTKVVNKLFRVGIKRRLE